MSIIKVLIEQGEAMATVLAERTTTMQVLEHGLVKAVSEVTSTMFNYESKVIPLTEVDAAPPGLSAIVGFGGKISGFIAIHMTSSSACTMASALLGMSFDDIDDLVSDAMGEMVNMLAGGLKKYASQDEDIFKISVPSIIYGKSYSTYARKDAQQLMLGFQSGPCTYLTQLVVELH